ncbi:MAG: hypothetical protein EXS13_06490 [Planctomycetes bacterium]|nr:hypothetical protein [Planctomycetota bacterium]
MASDGCGRALRLAIAVLATTFCAGCRSEPELSWKKVVLAGVDRAELFEWARETVLAHYGGTTIKIDAAAGKIETGELEEVIGGKVLRERCCIDLRSSESGLELAVFVPMTRREFDPSSDTPVRWVTHGSDLVVEGILLDEICGKALVRDPDARIVSTDLPRLPARR